MTMLPPGPRSLAALQTYRYLSDPFSFLDECTARYGDTFTLRFVGDPPIVNFNAPEVIKDIFAASPDLMLAGEANKRFELALGSFSLVRLDGKRHDRERRLMMPSFHGERLRTYFDQIVAATDRVLDRIEVGDVFSVHAVMQPSRST
jgi:cytochrome P450